MLIKLHLLTPGLLQLRARGRYDRRGITSQPFEESKGAISRRHRTCRLVILSQPGTVASAASDSDPGLAAPSDRRKPRASCDETRVGSLNCSCLSAPRRAQYLFSGSR